MKDFIGVFVMAPVRCDYKMKWQSHIPVRAIRTLPEGKTEVERFRFKLARVELFVEKGWL